MNAIKGVNLLGHESKSLPCKLKEYETSHLAFFELYSYGERVDNEEMLKTLKGMLDSVIPNSLYYNVETSTDFCSTISLMIIVPARVYDSLDAKLVYEPSLVSLLFSTWKQICIDFNVSNNGWQLFNFDYSSLMYVKDPADDLNHLNYIIKNIESHFSLTKEKSYKESFIDSMLKGMNKFESSTLYQFDIKVPFDHDYKELVIEEFKLKLNKLIPCEIFIHAPITSNKGNYELSLFTCAKLIPDYNEKFMIGIKEYNSLETLIAKIWFITLLENNIITKKEIIFKGLRKEDVLSEDVYTFKGIGSDLLAIHLERLYTSINNVINAKRLRGIKND